MKKFFFISILALFVITACNKKRTLHIKAINAVTGEPYAGLAYGISATTTGIGGEKKVYDHKGTLDANGEAFVTLRVRGNRTYNVGCTKPPNTCYVKDINFSFGKEDKTKNDFQFEYAECTQLIMKIKNINCINSSDNISITMDNQIHSLTQVPWNLGGCQDFTSATTDVPFGNYYFKWEVTKNGITNTFYDTVFIPRAQTYTYTINY
jgi:hypothetical protein